MRAGILLLVLTAATVVADDTNGTGKGYSPFGPEAIRSDAGGKSFEYVCRLVHVYASDHQLAAYFTVKDGDAKGRKIILSVNTHDPNLSANVRQVQQIATEFVSRTATNIQVRIELAGQLFRETTMLDPANKIILGLQELHETNPTLTQPSASTNETPPRR